MTEHTQILQKSPLYKTIFRYEGKDYIFRCHPITPAIGTRVEISTINEQGEYDWASPIVRDVVLSVSTNNSESTGNEIVAYIILEGE